MESPSDTDVISMTASASGEITDRRAASSSPEIAARPLSLRRNFTWTFAGNLLYTVARWGMLLVLVKLGDAAVVGVYGLSVAVCLPISFLTNLHLRPALVTDARGEFGYGHYIGLRLVGATLAVLITFVVSIVAGYPPSVQWIIVLVGIGTSVLSVREMFHAVMQKHECMNFSGWSQIILSFAAFGVFAATFAITRSLAWAVVGLLVVRAGLMFGYDIPMACFVLKRFAKPGEQISLRPDWSARMLWKLCVRVLPLGLAMTIGSFSNNVPAYFLESYHGASALGYYTAMMSVTTAVIMLVSALGVAASPRFAQTFLSDRRRFLRLLVQLQLLLGGICALAIVVFAVLGKIALTILFKAEYAEYTVEFMWLTVGMAFMVLASNFSSATTAARAFITLLCAWIAAAVASVVLSWALIPLYGIQGAAWARAGSSIALFFAMAVAMFVTMKLTPVAARVVPSATPDIRGDIT
ncbi:MAG: hypothetical protein JXO22_09255 [Phycisphaerae bacterium]|nr:hypothetical protein [Phycisphaerae bacterium]